jgi:hypothetical protein
MTVVMRGDVFQLADASFQAFSASILYARFLSAGLIG